MITPADIRTMTRAAEFAAQVHHGQLYEGKPYSASHLNDVVNVLIDSGLDTDAEVIAAGWLHDTVEDTDVTLPCIRKRFGERVKNLVDACTGVGANRKERNASIYAKLYEFPEACVVKLADRIANVEHSEPGSRYRSMYRKEQGDFAYFVQPHVPPAMWARLERALNA